jgi:hypothetical protein
LEIFSGIIFLCQEKRYISKRFSFIKKEGYGLQEPGIIVHFLPMPVQEVIKIRAAENLFI